MGAADVVAGNKMVEGGGPEIPYLAGIGGRAGHARGWHVVNGRPRASITAPVVGKPVPLRIPFKSLQMLELDCANTLASMKAGEDAHGDDPEQFPLEL